MESESFFNPGTFMMAIWILSSIVIGALGKKRKIGFTIAFFLALLLTPIVGLIATLFSQEK